MYHTIKEAREAVMLYRVLLKHRNELNLAEVDDVSIDPVSRLRNKIEECGDTDYLEHQIKIHGTETNLDLVLAWWKGQNDNMRKYHNELDEWVASKRKEKDD